MTPTSYAILGLLAIQAWSTYELTKLMRRALLAVWPRAESNLYREPQRLVAAGLATSRRVDVGRRRRTEYAITPEGRRALQDWLDSPSAPTTIESEGALKVLFSNNASIEALQQRLADFGAEAIAADEPWREIARDYLAGRGQFPERAHVNLLYWVLLDRWARLRADWARWASAVVDTWPDERGPGDRTETLRLLEAALADDPDFLRKGVSRGEAGASARGRASRAGVRSRRSR
ncbi:MAG TPA: PadR family transcriptional regulator [Candidatus Limnocylindrales bacterium]|nr:PadR family transcriptional regulator [Candidatus Limnocylindrales bacterium]